MKNLKGGRAWTKANIERPPLLPLGLRATMTLLNTLLRQMCRGARPARLGSVGSCTGRPTEKTLKVVLASAISADVSGVWLSPPH